MARTLVALVVGTLLGVAATLLLTSGRDALPGLADSPLTVFPAESTFPVAGPAAPEASRDFYRRLAEADAAELAGMIEQAAAEPPSTDRDLALAVLLKRIAELDVVRAVRLAREARVRGAALGVAYAAWARVAPGQVLTALSTIDSPEDAADVALALVVTLGNDAKAVQRVAAVLAEREPETPVGAGAAAVGPAFAPAAPLATIVSRSALGLVAARWADLAPQRALAVAREIGDERIRLVFEAAALRAVARVAPDEIFAELARLGAGSPQLRTLTGTLLDLARTSPERLLESMSELPSDVRRIAESVAMQQLAERDPLAAVRRLERMPLGVERQALLQLVARSYGKRDAAAALTWARSFPARQNLVAAVIGGVAEQDSGRALDLALELTAPMERVQAVQYVAMTGARSDEAAEAIANRLLTIEDPSLQESLTFGVMSTWASRAPDSAMRWLLANGENASPTLFQNLGQQLAMRDPRGAVAYSAQIPAAAKESWIQGVAQGYAQNDPQGAVDWLRQYRSETWYDRAATTVAMNIAHTDGAAAARLVDDLEDEGSGMQAQQLASVIAASWASRDPVAAAAWAIDRPTEAERTIAVRSMIGAWSSQDGAAARQWTLRLPQGDLRDGALTTLLTTSAFRERGGLDTGLLNAFASEQASQQAVMQVVQGLVYADPQRARSVADAHVTNPAVRAQVERMIEAARNNAGRPQLPMGIVEGVRPIPPSIVFQGTN